MQTDAISRTERIADLNDTLRTTFLGGKVMLTQTVDALPMCKKAALFKAIKGFSAFSEDNDPHGEHDFVSVVLDGSTYFAKIDYYAPDMQHGSEDPSSRANTVRVLTIMRSDDY
jgi:hypothetical protein